MVMNFPLQAKALAPNWLVLQLKRSTKQNTNEQIKLIEAWLGILVGGY